MSDPTPILQLNNVSKSYGSGNGVTHVLANVSLSIREGEFVAILGFSGSGKTTLISTIAGLVAPDGGEVLMRGRPVSEPGPERGIVFQSYSLMPWLTVHGNIMLAVETVFPKASAAEREARVAKYIEMVGLAHARDRKPAELSGGMRQRVGFARALVVHPDLLLMDEPFSALDVLTAETLRTDIIDLWIEGRLPMKSVLMVTHNIEEAVLMCDRILVFSSNPGRIASEMKVELAHPRNRLDPAFRQMVDRIYAIMTKRPEPQSPASVANAEGIPGTGVGMVLSHVSTNLLAGLIETVAADPFRGRADLPVLAERLQMEIDELFPLAEALQLLRFAIVAEGDIMLTDAGRSFADLDTDARKKLFARHLIDFVPLVGLIRRVLDERPSHAAPAARFRNELEDYMSEDYADETLETVVSWARYAEIFAYDEKAEMFSLENPS